MATIILQEEAATRAMIEKDQEQPQSSRGGRLVSYPDPNVRNDDYRLQYNITYRGSGQQVDRSCSGAPDCWRSNQNREFA